ncbi:MAG: glycosyltransferase family 2 protein [Lachnospiraceae bacterium]|nr:glycosyltransferase family 2 protein [Lachnospiraceae bacterium]
MRRKNAEGERKVVKILYLVIPCYNEMEVLPTTSRIFRKKIEDLVENHKISEQSKILFVDDGSKDDTWNIIQSLSEENDVFSGIRLSRNRGHQNALLAGLMEAKEDADVTISIDCDGQDDIEAIDRMLEEYDGGSEVVYGVRNDRQTDGFLKRESAQLFYRFMKVLGADIVYNHADYRLVSSKVLNELENFKEVNLFLRGMVPLVGFRSSCVYYERKSRMAGKTHYPLKRMLSLAFNGITSLSIRPLQMITCMGILISLLSFIGVFWSILVYLQGKTVSGWASMTCIVCFVSGVQMISLGIIGEYIGKMYLETKQRPRYIISEKTENKE